MENLYEKFTINKDGVTAPRGFSASGISAGIKKNGGLDIALVFSERPANAAGLFTLNKVRGHSLDLCANNLKDGNARCVFINSGNANACLGPSGYEDAVTITKKCASILNIHPGEVLTGSTGVIGHPLPMDKVLSGIKSACSELSSENGIVAARAIMTTDTYPKEASVSFEIKGKTVTIGGMAKGSGMIHPNMATIIGILTTDALISPALLKSLLKESADLSFNRISIDGDTSVCDKVLILANGMSETPEITEGTSDYDTFKYALTAVSVALAKMIAADGEGATKLIEIKVLNAQSPDDAHKAAKTVANSPLVKTAFYGEDANWGRILTAVGYSGAEFDPKETSIRIGPLLLYSKGLAIPFNESDAKKVLKEKALLVIIDFGTGSYDTTVWTCDLSHDYIDINANYRT